MFKFNKYHRYNWQAFTMSMLGVIFLLIFAYMPMAGLRIAFKDLDYTLNVMRGLKLKPYIGLKNFATFIKDRQFTTVLTNTLAINLLQLLICFPASIVFALLVNEIRGARFKKTIQTITYFPYFISWVVFAGILLNLLSSDGGIINQLLIHARIIETPIAFVSKPQYFWWIVVFSTFVKTTGWNSVIYLAAITGVDQQIYESAKMDGANRFQTILHITLPCIAGTITIQLLLSISHLLNSGFDQIYMLQNPLNLQTSEVLDTFIYKIGLTQRRYSYTTAAGLFKSCVAMTLLCISHLTSKKITGRGLF